MFPVAPAAAPGVFRLSSDPGCLVFSQSGPDQAVIQNINHLVTQNT